MHSYDGKLYKRVDTKNGPVVALDRFGQHLVFASDHSFGLINPSNFDIMIMCVIVIFIQNHDILTGIVIDTSISTSRVYLSTTTNHILAYDLRPNDDTEILECHRNFY